MLPPLVRRGGGSSSAKGPATLCREAVASVTPCPTASWGGSGTDGAQKPPQCHPGQQPRKDVGLKAAGCWEVTVAMCSWPSVGEGRGRPERVPVLRQSQAPWDGRRGSGVGLLVVSALWERSWRGSWKSSQAVITVTSSGSAVPGLIHPSPPRQVPVRVALHISDHRAHTCHVLKLASGGPKSRLTWA